MATLTLALPSYSFAEHGNDRRSQNCTLAGFYIGSIPGQANFTLTNTPLDRWARTMMLAIDVTGYGPTFDGVFPTAVGQSLLRGYAQRQAGGRYTGQLIRYRYDAARQVVATEIQAISLEPTGCQSLAIHFHARIFYFGYVNPGEDQLPQPDLVFDVTGAPPTLANKMRPYASNKPTPKD